MRVSRDALVGTLAACASFTVLSSAGAATYYVDAAAANDSGNGSAAQPKKSIRAGAALMSALGGDTVLIAAGTYTGGNNAIDGLVPGTANAWNTVKAQVDGSVTITAPLSLPLGDHYLRFEGLKWDYADQKSVLGRYVKLLRCAFKGGFASGNSVGLGIGTNDATPGAQYILIEDAYAYGPGGRYNILVYNADKVILRRVVARHENGWSDTQGNPQANVSLYNSTNIVTENLLLLDSRPSGYYEAALYHPSNGPAGNNVRDLGAIILNIGGNAVGWDGGNASSASRLEDSVIWNATYAASSNGSAHAGTMNRLTVVSTTSAGINDWNSGGNFSITNSLLWQIGGSNFQAVSHSGNVCFSPVCSGEASMNPATSGLRYLPRIEAGSALSSAGAGAGRVGADVTKRIGVSGTLYGEPGYDTLTAEPLWPWPNEAAIKSAMCGDMGISSGFCAAPTLTRYVWEMLGNPIPPEIYAGIIFANGFE
ncbi:MAG: hypothetical protein ABI411_09090 [Tahibacter sp.]